MLHIRIFKYMLNKFIYSLNYNYLFIKYIYLYNLPEHYPFPY